MAFCPFCGAEVQPDSLYCLNCGKKLPEKQKPGIADWETTPTQPTYQPAPSVTYKPLYQPKPYHPAMKAPMGERCIALLIDSAISTIFGYVFCAGFIYDIIKDGIREGQSLGKGLMGLRVVDFQTGMPATMGQSFIRNCCPGCLDGCCCYLVALIDQDGRRIGDQAAGTVVILDK